MKPRHHPVALASDRQASTPKGSKRSVGETSTAGRPVFCNGAVGMETPGPHYLGPRARRVQLPTPSNPYDLCDPKPQCPPSWFMFKSKGRLHTAIARKVRNLLPSGQLPLPQPIGEPAPRGRPKPQQRYLTPGPCQTTPGRSIIPAADLARLSSNDCIWTALDGHRAETCCSAFEVRTQSLSLGGYSEARVRGCSPRLA